MKNMLTRCALPLTKFINIDLETEVCISGTADFDVHFVGDVFSCFAYCLCWYKADSDELLCAGGRTLVQRKWCPVLAALQGFSPMWSRIHLTCWKWKLSVSSAFVLSLWNVSSMG